MADAKRRANKYAVHPKFEWVFISDDGRQVEASSGIYMDCDVLIDAARDLHYAFVLAGDEQARAHTRRICPWNITARCASTVPSS